MVKKISSSLAASNATSSKAIDKILALEAEVSRLRHHVSVLSKRVHKLDPPRRKSSRADSSPSPDIEVDILRSVSGGKAVEKEGVAEEKPPKAEEGEGGAVAVVVAEDVAMATFEAGAVAVEFREKRRRLEDKERLVEEDVVVGGKIVPLGGLEPRRVEVVGVGSSTVVPQAPRAMQGLREREGVQGAPAGPGGSGGTGIGVGPSRGRGLHGYGTRSGGGSVPGGVPYPFGYGSTGGYYARGRGRGRGWGGGAYIKVFLCGGTPWAWDTRHVRS